MENPLTLLADDTERTRKMIAACKGPVLLVGYSYGGAVITEAGKVGLVYIVAFAPDAGESPGGITAKHPPLGRRILHRTATKASYASLASMSIEMAALIDKAAIVTVD